MVVNAAASAMDPGHRYGDAPAKGEGLAAALDAGAAAHGSAAGARSRTTFAGFNGESFDAKLWGVARLRHNDFFSPTMVIEHPADKFGDAGAATGAILVALAAEVAGERTRVRARRWSGRPRIANRAPAPSCLVCADTRSIDEDRAMPGPFSPTPAASLTKAAAA